MATDWMTKNNRTGNDAVNILRKLAKDMKMIITMLDETREQGAWLRKKPVRSTEDSAPTPCRDTTHIEADTSRLKELEEENRQLKQMFAELSLEHQALKDLIKRKL
jgi:predicted transcriptional regulator